MRSWYSWVYVNFYYYSYCIDLLCAKKPRLSLLFFLSIIVVLYNVDFVIYAPATLLTVIKYWSIVYEHVALFLEACGFNLGEYSISIDMDNGLSHCVDTLLSNESSSRRITARAQSSVLLDFLNSACLEFNHYIRYKYQAGDDLHIKFAALLDAVESSKNCTAHVCHLYSIATKSVELNVLFEHFNIAERSTFRLPHLFIWSVGITIFICILLIYLLLRLTLCFCNWLLDVMLMR